MSVAFLSSDLEKFTSQKEQQVIVDYLYDIRTKLDKKSKEQLWQLSECSQKEGILKEEGLNVLTFLANQVFCGFNSFTKHTSNLSLGRVLGTSMVTP